MKIPSISDTDGVKYTLSYLKELYEQNTFECDLHEDYLLSYYKKGKKTVGLFAHADVVPVLYIRPKNMHEYAHYQLEKIFSYLDKRSEHIELESNEAWGLIQAHEFSQEFAKKWVKIDVKTMSYDEIHLLVSTACYLESKEQEKNNK